MAEEETKIFVGALSGNTTSESMQRYFSKFGDIVESKVMMDNVTNHSRGFGFVKFRDVSSVSKALSAPRPHVVDGKEVDPKPCTPKDVQMQKKEAERTHVTTHKIFVGGLTQNMEESEVKEYFEKMGTVVEVSFAISKEDRKNKGFGFVTFENSSSVDNAVKTQFHMISGKRVEAKRAQPRDRMKPANNAQAAQAPQGNGGAYPGNNWGGMPWGGMQGMGGGPMMPPGGGYPPNSGYGGYGGYSNYQGYGGYGGYGMANNYPQMGNYGQQNSSNYNAMPGSNNSSGDSRSYHPYKR